jgi:hypothetical protein
MTRVEQLVDVTAVEVIGDYQLRLTFEGGTVGDVDFSGREWHGVFKSFAIPATSPGSRSTPKPERSPGPTASTLHPNRSTKRPERTSFTRREQRAKPDAGAAPSFRRKHTRTAERDVTR